MAEVPGIEKAELPIGAKAGNAGPRAPAPNVSIPPPASSSRAGAEIL